jgi:lipopolysaccharide biosynthesis regulator YciM
LGRLLEERRSTEAQYSGLFTQTNQSQASVHQYTCNLDQLAEENEAIVDAIDMVSKDLDGAHKLHRIRLDLARVRKESAELEVQLRVLQSSVLRKQLAAHTEALKDPKEKPAKPGGPRFSSSRNLVNESDDEASGF